MLTMHSLLSKCLASLRLGLTVAVDLPVAEDLPVAVAVTLRRNYAIPLRGNLRRRTINP